MPPSWHQDSTRERLVMNLRIRCCVLLFCCLTLRPAAAAEPREKLREVGNPADVGMDAKGLEKIAARMEEFVRAKQAAGIVTLVARRGQLVHLKAVGLAQLSTVQVMVPFSEFAIASMTKPITATAVMILLDEGKLKLDDP